jgi:hypothetical protein
MQMETIDFTLRIHAEMLKVKSTVGSPSSPSPPSSSSIAAVNKLLSALDDQRVELVQNWRKEVQENVNHYPYFCFDHEVNNKLHVLRAAADQDILDGFCLANGGVYARKFPKPSTCKQLATTSTSSSLPFSPSAAMFCASYSGVSMLMSAKNNNPRNAMLQCLDDYNDPNNGGSSIATSSAKMSAVEILGGACVTGVVSGLRNEMRKPYGVNEIMTYDASPFVASNYWAPSSRIRYGQEIKKQQESYENIRCFSEETAMQMCGFLLNQTRSISNVHDKHLRLFGVCIAESLSDHIQYAKEYGACILESVQEIKEANNRI